MKLVRSQKKKGTFLLKSLVNDLVVSEGNTYKDFISELSDEELGKLDEILGTDHLSRKKELKKHKKDWIIQIIPYAAALLVTTLLIGYILIWAFGNPLMGWGLGSNSTINDTENNSIPDGFLKGLGNLLPSLVADVFTIKLPLQEWLHLYAPYLDLLYLTR